MIKTIKSSYGNFKGLLCRVKSQKQIISQVMIYESSSTPYNYISLYFDCRTVMKISLRPPWWDEFNRANFDGVLWFAQTLLIELVVQLQGVKQIVGLRNKRYELAWKGSKIWNRQAAWKPISELFDWPYWWIWFRTTFCGVVWQW